MISHKAEKIPQKHYVKKPMKYKTNQPIKSKSYYSSKHILEKRITVNSGKMFVTNEYLDWLQSPVTKYFFLYNPVW